ncbi:MAG: hypothetical protein LBU35_03085 [Holosporales bacterium]|jgi:hypothetical protein|nr:hypothetical protein [Holosporales bacterium]
MLFNTNKFFKNSKKIPLTAKEFWDTDIHYSEFDKSSNMLPRGGYGMGEIIPYPP